MSLMEYTTKQLEEEIKRRKEKPQLRSDVDSIEFYNVLAGMANKVVEEMYETGSYDYDIKTYMFESVMKLFYGEDYFKWHNSITERSY